MKLGRTKALLLCVSLNSATLLPMRAAEPADDKEVTEAVLSMFAAFSADDVDRFHAVTTPDFYAYDVGKRFERDALMELIKKVHAAGTVIVWNITEPIVHAHGDIAWITYVNEGSVQDASGTKKVTWLESAVLRKQDGSWRVQFLHSTRVPPA
jgi:ketosteroid isomerase-like protein